MELDKVKDEFLANTSHELRTPLNAMINIADGITRGTEGEVNEKQKNRRHRTRTCSNKAPG